MIIDAMHDMTIWWVMKVIEGKKAERNVRCDGGADDYRFADAFAGARDVAGFFLVPSSSPPSSLPCTAGLAAATVGDDRAVVGAGGPLTADDAAAAGAFRSGAIPAG